MRAFQIGSGDSQGFDSGNFRALHLIANLIHTTANTAFSTAQQFDWSKLQVKLTLIRNKRDYVIFSDVALPLILASCFKNGMYDEVKGGGTPTQRRLVVAAASIKEVMLISAYIELPGCINLMPGDKLKVDLTSQTTAVNTANVDVAASRILWELVEGVGNSLSIPCIKCRSITAGQSSTDENFGDGITKILFINNDKFSILTADHVVTSYSLTSDKLSKTDTIEELLIQRLRAFNDSLEADGRHQSLILYDRDMDNQFDSDDYKDVRLNRASVRLTLTSTNVNAGMNWLVAFGFIADLSTAKRAVNRKEKHDQRNATQYLG